MYKNNYLPKPLLVSRFYLLRFFFTNCSSVTNFSHTNLYPPPTLAGPSRVFPLPFPFSPIYLIFFLSSFHQSVSSPCSSSIPFQFCGFLVYFIFHFKGLYRVSPLPCGFLSIGFTLVSLDSIQLIIFFLLLLSLSFSFSFSFSVSIDRILHSVLFCLFVYSNYLSFSYL